MASKNVFLYHFSFFSRSVALLCGSKKASIDTKTLSSAAILKQLHFSVDP